MSLLDGYSERKYPDTVKYSGDLGSLTAVLIFLAHNFTAEWSVEGNGIHISITRLISLPGFPEISREHDFISRTELQVKRLRTKVFSILDLILIERKASAHCI
jgi:hypothetical protein